MPAAPNIVFEWTPITREYLRRWTTHFRKNRMQGR